MRPWRWIVPAALLASFAAAAAEAPAAGDARLEQLVAKVEAHYRALEAFKVSFRQHYQSVTFGSEDEAKGEVIVAGGRMLWLYDSPRGQKGALDGERYWLIVPEDRQVIVRDVSPGGGDPLAGLLRGRSDILKTFALAPVVGEGSGSLVVVKLTPLERREDLDRAVLTIDEAAQAVRRLEVFDPLGNRMVFELGTPQVVRPPPPEAFKLTIPPGFTVTTE